MEKVYMALIEALNNHTAALDRFSKAASAGKGGTAASSGGEKASTTKNTTKPAAPTLETIQERFGAYLSVTDKDERKLRAAKVADINKHFGVERISKVDEEHYEEALEYLDMLEAGKKIKFRPKPDADEGEGEEESPI